MLTVDKVEAAYGPIQALFGVSLEVPSGASVALLGPNGAGKTTMLRVIIGLLRARTGAVELEGRPIHRLSTDRRIGMGLAMVPEGRALFPDMTVKENLELGAYVHRHRRGDKATLAWIHQLFPMLAERSGQHAGTLSGGQQQMLAIGRALMSRPRLLLLDEPSLGLAPTLVDEVFGCIRDINRQGTTVLLVEQNASAALDVAEYGYILESGQIVAEGSSDELIARPDIKQAYLGQV